MLSPPKRVSGDVIKILNKDLNASTISNDIDILDNVDEDLYVTSDCDPELLILVEFERTIKLYNLVIYAKSCDLQQQYDTNDPAGVDMDGSSAPKEIYIYRTQNININFQDIQSMKTNKKTSMHLKCSIDKLQKGQLIKLNNIPSFKAVKYLVIYVKSNQNDTEKTYINGISFNLTKKSFKFETEDIKKTKQFEELVMESKNETEEKHIASSYFYKRNDGRKSQCQLSECDHLSAITAVLTRYHACIQKRQNSQIKIITEEESTKCSQTKPIIGHINNEKSKQNDSNNADEEKCKWMQRVYDDNYSNTDLLDDFNHLLYEHSNVFEEIYNILIANSNNECECELTDCLLLRRNQRDRDNYDRNKKELYFNGDAAERIQQQLLDRIHCFYFHSFDIGYKLRNAELENIVDEEIKTDDDKTISVDIARFQSIIQSKRSSYTNLRELQRLNRVKNKYIMEHNDNQNEFGCFSFGVRYFYWSFYKINPGNTDPAHNRYGSIWISYHFLFSTNAGILRVGPANQGYQLMDWYIAPKHKNLKEELLDNALKTITLCQYLDLLTKAAIHIKSNVVKNMVCELIDTAKCYDLKHGQLIKAEHLMVMMLYCDYDQLQSSFSETYRRQITGKISGNIRMENDDELKTRHRNYYWVGRYLRECVECYGANAPRSAEFKVWHGVDKQLTFSSMYAYIKGPFSTTTDQNVAVNFCNGRGLVLELNLNKNDWMIKESKRMCCFDCSWISSFVNEQEVFFIGGLYKFKFDTIIATSGDNYMFWIKALKQMTHNMSVGDWPGDIGPAETKTDKQRVFRLLSHEIYRHFPNHSKAVSLPESASNYLRNILKYHSMNMRVVMFLTQDNDKNVQDTIFKYDISGENQIGWIKIDLLMTIFPSIERIVFNAKLNDVSFLEDVQIYYSVLKYLKKHYKDTTLKSIEIVIDPKYWQRIQTHIDRKRYYGDFNRYKWSIYVHFIKNAFDWINAAAGSQKINVVTPHPMASIIMMRKNKNYN